MVTDGRQGGAECCRLTVIIRIKENLIDHHRVKGKGDAGKLGIKDLKLPPQRPESHALQKETAAE